MGRQFRPWSKPFGLVFYNRLPEEKFMIYYDYDKDAIAQYTVGRVVMKTKLAIMPGVKDTDVIGHIAGFVISLHDEVLIDVQWAGKSEIGKLESVPGKRYPIHPKNIILL
jgi:hypothetical protein